LIADPDDQGRATIAGLLGEGGYEVIEAARGDAALACTRDQPPRVAILEVALPGVCGYEVCRRLREDFAETISVVLVSATRTESFDRVAGFLLGADDYLAKPLASDELLARVGRLISGRHPASQPASKVTSREREVLVLLDAGLAQREIAQHLGISPKTVGTHLEHIFSKLGARHRLQAVALARQQGLVGGR
jgi:DNA-binding NarL/FixJ family response regulator